ncbi:MAG: orotate phosphoribosyltransferase [Myxococcales bacterium]|nr:orotate phosphoribosyltransferase [Myxococcales bacterium]
MAGPRMQLLELLTEKSFQERPVVLSSGRKSNFYIDCKQTSLTAEGHFLIGQIFCAAIEKHAPTAEAIGGLTLGADPLASATATTSYIGGRPLQAFLIRKEAKGHGTEEYLEGMSNLRSGMPVVILEDVVTTGASTIKAIERARAAGLDVVLALALVDRDEGGREKVEEHAPLLSLFTRHDFMAP